jgi:glycosyltransferase involved in cell wall biosynthesis
MIRTLEDRSRWSVGRVAPSVSGALPFVSVVIPAYNEAAILEQNLTALCRHLTSLEREYRWEILLIDDGSSDETGSLAESFAAREPNVRVLHHVTNCGIGRAFQSAFDECQGDYIVVVDLDLSYSPDHIEKLLARIRTTHAQIVVASPYMDGGRVSNVPWLRRTLSVWANRFLSVTVKGSLSTLTGMVRAYDARFVRGIDLSSDGMDVNPEIIHKALLLKARVEEVPAHLDWKLQNAVGKKRRSSMRLVRQIMAVLLAGYLFRPVMFFIVPGLLLLSFSAYVNAWVVIHFFERFGEFNELTWFFSRASAAVAASYRTAPHTFIVGIGSLMLGIQLISLGILALQSQRYFEEIFHLGTAVYGAVRGDGYSKTRSNPARV